MGVDDDRRATARERRRNVLEAFSTHLAAAPGSGNAVDKLRLRLAEDRPRVVVTGLDIDSLVSSAMLAGSSSWRIGVVNVRNAELLVHPDLDWPALLADAEQRLFGVDLFSLRFPSVSNHPVLFGEVPRRPVKLRQFFEEWDAQVRSHMAGLGSINPSAWASIGASLGSASPYGMQYKYPLGTAQILLAALEIAGAQPRLFDRQYLPWMIANADGGATSIRTYAWNAELWWSALAAAAGPASNSEAIYRLVTQQRPSEFLEVDRRLRWDEPERSQALRGNWNVRAGFENVAHAIDLITSWSGWLDPFMGGAKDIGTWTKVPTTGNILALKGVTKLSGEDLATHVGAAMQAVHVNFSDFRERGRGLGWMLPERRLDIERLLGSEAPEEAVEDDDQSVPDAES